jgi:hypothetical protein
MNRDNLAKLCALLSAFREFYGDDSVDEAFGAAWDAAVKTLNNDELAGFYHQVNELQVEIESEDVAGVEV